VIFLKIVVSKRKVVIKTFNLLEFFNASSQRSQIKFVFSHSIH
jgi:hypothetical protein